MAKKKSTKRKGNKKKTQKSNGCSKKIFLSFLILALVGFIYVYYPEIRDISYGKFSELISGNRLKSLKNFSFSESLKGDKTSDIHKKEKLSKFYPSSDLENGGIVEHLAYSLDYNESHEQPDWVCYELTRKEVKTKAVPRKDHFRKDPVDEISSSEPKDYVKSGYDRGHLCPAADNRWSAKAMDESFYMSNMSPQHADLNRKIWAELEKKVREWAVEEGSVYVVTGPILKDGYKKKSGKNRVSVPYYYYKVVADLTGNDIKGIGFIFSNGMNNGDLINYSYSIDTIEERTGIDFFYKLDIDFQDRFEKELNRKEWFK